MKVITTLSLACLVLATNVQAKESIIAQGEDFLGRSVASVDENEGLCIIRSYARNGQLNAEVFSDYQKNTAIILQGDFGGEVTKVTYSHMGETLDLSQGIKKQDGQRVMIASQSGRGGKEFAQMSVEAIGTWGTTMVYAGFKGTEIKGAFSTATREAFLNCLDIVEAPNYQPIAAATPKSATPETQGTSLNDNQKPHKWFGDYVTYFETYASTWVKGMKNGDLSLTLHSQEDMILVWKGEQEADLIVDGKNLGHTLNKREATAFRNATNVMACISGTQNCSTHPAKGTGAGIIWVMEDMMIKE